jgi:hypothetical protein
MNIQDEVQKIHHQYGTTFKASYEIQKLFDNELKKMYSEEEVLQMVDNYRHHFELYRNIQVLPDMFFEWFDKTRKHKS